MDLLIVTVSYNTRELLADCLHSILAGLRYSNLVGEVWVVDNASADDSAEMVRQMFPDVCLIAHHENLGFAGGNNLALRKVGLLPPTPPSDPGFSDQPRHILFLNPDTRVIGDALGTLVRFLDSTPTAGAVGAGLVHGDGTFQHSAFAFPGLMQILLDFFPLHHRVLDSRLNGRYPRRWYQSGQPFGVDHPLGAALMVRGDVLAQVGSFDQRFFMYCEEIDLCRRIKAQGWQIYCLPQARIVHLVAQSTQQFREPMFVALWKSRFLMFEKHESKIFRWFARRLVGLGLWSERRRARSAWSRSEIDSAQLEARLGAYREVAAL
jgi:GT2 family glycosyltransferase